MKRLFTVMMLLSAALTLLAAYPVTGKVVDFGTKQPIDFANVSVIKANGDEANGEKLVTGAITDVKGEFSIEVEDGQYVLVVSFMGYTEQSWTRKCSRWTKTSHLPGPV